MKLDCAINECKGENIERHHEDYSKPFDIIPLCRGHHRELHNGSPYITDFIKRRK